MKGTTRPSVTQTGEAEGVSWPQKRSDEAPKESKVTTLSAQPVRSTSFLIMYQRQWK